MVENESGGWGGPGKRLRRGRCYMPLVCLLGQRLPKCRLWNNSSVRCSVKKKLLQSNYVRTFLQLFLRSHSNINIIKAWLMIRITKKKPVFLCFSLAFYG